NSTLVGMPQLTILVWAKNNKTFIDATGGELIFSKAGSGTPDSYIIYWAMDEAYGCQIDTGGGLKTHEPGDKMQDTEWHQYGLHYNGATLSVIFDGVIKSGGTAVTGLIASNAGHSLGIGGEGTNASWDGLIDHAVMWGRALTSNEVALLYREPFCMFEKDNIALMAVEAPAPGGGQVIMITSLPLLFIGLYLWKYKEAA
ncbi:hypothetical protein LCGC14_1743750, partial [marine sediment metagenome]